MGNSNNNSWVECISPIIGMFIGSTVGFIIFILLPDDANFVQEMGARFYAFLFSIIGWLISLLARGKCFYCGGLKDLNTTVRGKHNVLLLFLIAGMVFLPLLLFQNELAYFYGIAFILTGIILGEVGCNSPWCFFNGNWKNIE